MSRPSPTTILALLPAAVVGWWNGNLLRLGASLAYYTLFAIAPILLVAIAVAGSVFGDEAVRGEIIGQIDGLVGRDGGAAVQALIEGARNRQSNLLAAAIGTLTSMLAAGAVFLELQAALNAVWQVQPASRGLIKGFLVSRARSFGLVLAVGFLLLVSLALSAALAAVGAWLGTQMPGVPMAMAALSWLVSIATTAVLFALLFKVLPDVSLRWRDVAVGGLVTAVLFTVGQCLIGLYLGRSGTTSSYGALGSVVVLLLWVYYSSQVLLIGAEFTRLYTERALGARPQASRFGRAITTGRRSGRRHSRAEDPPPRALAPQQTAAEMGPGFLPARAAPDSAIARQGAPTGPIAPGHCLGSRPPFHAPSLRPRRSQNDTLALASAMACRRGAPRIARHTA